LPSLLKESIIGGRETNGNNKMVFRLKLGKKYNKSRKLTLKRLLEVLDIDSEAGECFWKVAIARCIKIGDRAGCIWKSHSEDLYYRQIRIDGKIYYEHVLIWFFVTGKWPSRNLDHRNRDGLDNRFKNLRLCTGTQNNGNIGLQKNNSSGLKGVYWDKRWEKWVARIQYKGKQMCLGGFDDPYEAHLTYCKVHKELFGKFSRTR
jgi:hypothetical protein